MSILSDVYTHEDLLFGEDALDEDTEACGPTLRNKFIFDKLINHEFLVNEYKTDKEKKSIRSILKLIKDEIKEALDKHLDGIAMISLGISRLTKGTAYSVTFFHKGDVLVVRTFGKTSVRHYWGDPLKEDTLHYFRDMWNKDKKYAIMKLASIIYDFGGKKYHLTCPQDDDVFNHCCDEKYSEYCWKCGVSLRRVKRSLCAGCLKARYCTLECQGGDRDRHRDYCIKMEAKREAKRTSKIKEVIESIDSKQEVD